jgi:hypothetical protein
LAKTYGFQIDGAVFGYAAEWLSRGREAPAFISQDAYGMTQPVFAVMAITHWIEHQTGWSIKQFVRVSVVT